MASSFQYGDYTLGATNGISVNVVREKSPAERTVGLLQPARSRGMEVVSLTSKAKIIEIEGTISHSGSLNTFTDYVRDFVSVFLEQGDFFVSAGDGLFIYEDCIVLNPESMLRNEAHYNIDFIPFTIQLLAPKGVAVATDLTTNTFNNISGSPYTNEITVGGTAIPEPIITLTLDSTGGSTISNLIFLNRDTNEQVSIATTYVNDDKVVIDTKSKKVLYNTKTKRFTGLLPRFKLGDNRFKIDVEASDTVHQSQTNSDFTRSVFGNTYLAQEVQPSGNITVPQVDILLKRIETPAVLLSLYDDFNDNTKNTNKFTYTQTVNEAGGVMDILGAENGNSITSIASTDNKTGGDPIIGGKWFQQQALGTHGPGGTARVRLTNGTDYIEIAHLIDVHDMIIRLGGTYGSGDSTRWDGSGGNIEIVEVGSNIEVRFNGAVMLTLSGKSIAANSYWEATCNVNSPGSGANSPLRIDNLQFYVETEGTSNSDLTVELQTDSAGVPSGTAVTNGSTTIKAGDISTSAFTIVPAVFKNNPTLSSATVYHIVLKQTGGDVNNFYSVKVNTAGGYASGNVETTINAGTNWSEQTGEDLWFKLYNSFPSSFNLDAQLDYFVTHHSVA